MTELILGFFSNLFGSSYIAEHIITIIISVLPVIELRGAIPCGVILGLPVHTAALISIVGNMIPVPFVILFSRKIFGWMRGKSIYLGRLADSLEDRAKKKGMKLYRGMLIGLMIFVAIPLPGTGAWTGALIAAILDIRIKAAIPAIGAGVIIAGVLVAGITFGFRSLLF